MPRILLVEDNVEQRNLYHEVLTEAGYEVEDAASGHEALRTFKEKKADLIVLDIQMPGMDGIEALGKLISLERTVPVLFYSAFPAFKQNFMTWAADAFVEKTGEPQELVAAVHDVCERHGVGRPALGKLKTMETQARNGGTSKGAEK